VDEAEQARIERELGRFVHAVRDMKDVAGGALFLRESLSDRVRSLLETGLVVTYARPFKKNDDGHALKGDWAPEEDDLLLGHCKLIRLRDKVYAHTDRTPEREAVNVTRILGIGGNRWSARRWLLPTEWLDGIVKLAEYQRARFELEQHRLEIQLPDWEPAPVPLYYRTSAAEAQAILDHGFTDNACGMLGTGETKAGVYAHDEPGDTADAATTVLLHLSIPEARIRLYELVDYSASVREWLIPADVLNEYGPPVVLAERAG